MSCCCKVSSRFSNSFFCPRAMGGAGEGGAPEGSSDGRRDRGWRGGEAGHRTHGTSSYFCSSFDAQKLKMSDTPEKAQFDARAPWNKFSHGKAKTKTVHFGDILRASERPTGPLSHAAFRRPDMRLCRHRSHRELNWAGRFGLSRLDFTRQRWTIPAGR